MRYGVATDYTHDPRVKRDYLKVWSGSWFDTFEADGVSLPRLDGYMLTTYNGEKVRVECPCPRSNDNYQIVDAAIDAALNAHYGETVAEPPVSEEELRRLIAEDWYRTAGR